MKRLVKVKFAEVSEVLTPKCSTSNEEMTRDTEGTFEIGNSKSSCDQFLIARPSSVSPGLQTTYT